MKERATFTIEENLLEQIDSMIDGSKVKNRSHAVELLLMKAFGRSSPKYAVILAGGEGIRLKPITQEIPKPLIPVHDRPIIEHNIDLLRKYGITNVFLSVGYKGNKIRDYFGDGSKFGCKFTYLFEDKPLGTAGPLNMAKKHIDSTFVLANADELKNIDLHDMYRMHKESNALITIALTSVEDPSSYGVAKLQGNKILSFVEKPNKEEAPSKFINAGLYIIEPEIFEHMPNKEEISIEREVFPKIASIGRLYGYPFSGQWMDTGTLERYQYAIENWKGLE